MSGICTSIRNTSKACRSSTRALRFVPGHADRDRAAPAAAPRASDSPACLPPAARAACRPRNSAFLDRRGQRGSSPARRLPRRPPPACSARDEVKHAAPARAGSSPRSARPSASTSREQMASPSPVPPYLRVVDPSACRNGVENHVTACRGDSNAGIGHREMR